jgi:hypothetical protein
MRTSTATPFFAMPVEIREVREVGKRTARDRAVRGDVGHVIVNAVRHDVELAQNSAAGLVAADVSANHDLLAVHRGDEPLERDEVTHRRRWRWRDRMVGVLP